MTNRQPNGLDALLDGVAHAARAAGVFSSVQVSGGRLTCEAAASAEPASYRLEHDGERLWVSLVMADRWLSESIETDLMHSGDKLEELLEDELVEQGYDGDPLPFQHFRSDDMLFTFRSPVPLPSGGLSSPASVDVASKCLLAYEACFAQLGDMSSGDEE